jgi:hypothetical protein
LVQLAIPSQDHDPLVDVQGLGGAIPELVKRGSVLVPVDHEKRIRMTGQDSTNDAGSSLGTRRVSRAFVKYENIRPSAE